MSLILASGSPRRRELMALITPNYTVAPSDVDESRITPQRLPSWPRPWQKPKPWPWRSSTPMIP